MPTSVTGSGILFNDGTSQISNVTTTIATTPIASIGTYAYLSHITVTTNIVANSTYSGSVLVYTGHQTDNSSAISYGYGAGSGSVLSGTWRAMGTAVGAPGAYSQTLMLRIA